MALWQTKWDGWIWLIIMMFHKKVSEIDCCPLHCKQCLRLMFWWRPLGIFLPCPLSCPLWLFPLFLFFYISNYFLVFLLNLAMRLKLPLIWEPRKISSLKFTHGVVSQGNKCVFFVSYMKIYLLVWEWLTIVICIISHRIVEIRVATADQLLPPIHY